jgi:tetratricopeptide (TPR) repeat protein
MKPSPLDVGDSLFLQKKYDEAIDRYGEAAQSVNAGSSRIEALYKQGLCNLQLNREDEARKIFEGVAAGFITSPQSTDKRWYFLADCQLLVLHFRDQDGIERATEILDKLKEYQYSFDRLALLMPPDVRRQVLHSAQIGSVGGNFHRRPEEHVARIEFAVRASELLESPAQRGEWVYQGLMRAYMMVGRNLDAIRIAEKSFRIFRFGGEALDDYCWIRRLTGDEKEIRQALDALDRTLPADPQRLIERCRLHVALKEWDAALADVDGYLAKPEDYHTFSAACLIRGFLLERRGAPPELVEEAWRRGLLKNWRPPKSDPSVPGYDAARGLLGMPMLQNWIMASLCSDMSDVDAEQMLSGLMAFAGKDNPVFNKLMRPSILRATWRTPRARDVARHVAFRDVPFSDVARFPLFVGWIAFVHEVCFKSSEPLSPEQDELLWRMSGEIYAAYRDGMLTDRYFLPFGVIVSGNPNAPGMGWTEVAKLLEKSPTLRGPLGYVFGQRYLKKGDLTTALLFFKSALADSDREPPQPILKRLALTEINALSGK